MSITPEDLRQFTGTETWTRHWLRKLLMTEGVMYFAEKAGAHWFTDIVATELVPLLKKEPFLHIKMNVGDGCAVIQADDGNGKLVFTKEITFTTCPPGEWRFYLTDNVLMVPSEY